MPLCRLQRLRPDTQYLIYELDHINPGVPVFIYPRLGIQLARLYQEMDDPKNDLFFGGYQAKGTSGRAIVEGRSLINAVHPHLSDLHSSGYYIAGNVFPPCRAVDE
jgi:hypothetical protein